MRAALAQVISRPSLNQLAPTRIDFTLDRTYEVFYDGNADLEPVEADQADLSLEWYFDDKSVLSAAAFWKDLDGFITYELQENVDIGVVGSIGGAPARADPLRRRPPDQRRQRRSARVRVRLPALLRQRVRAARQLHVHGYRSLPSTA